MDKVDRAHDAVVVGAGVSGLVAATLLAREGHRVALCERADHVGGRARSTVHDGFVLNLGPHAVYRDGPAARTLGALGVELRGATPDVRGAELWTESGPVPLPRSTSTLLASSHLGWRTKLGLVRLLGSLREKPSPALAVLTTEQWIEAATPDKAAQAFATMLARISTYCAEVERLRADVAMRQLWRATFRGVVYLDHGWQSLVTQLTGLAKAAGVTLLTGRDVLHVEPAEQRECVRFADGTEILARAVIFTTGPAACMHALGVSQALRETFAALRPMRAACLDLAMTALPEPRRRLALGLAEPIYYSVHSSVAELAPAGGAVVHVMRYLRDDDDERGDAIRLELETWLDALQPGWRDRVVHARFSPKLVVGHGLPEVTRARPVVRALGARAVFFGADWVEGDYLLLDGAIDAVVRAVTLAREHLADQVAAVA